MKNIAVLLLLIAFSAVSQEAARELKNIHNDKYMDKYRYQNNGQTIVCESYNGRRNHCRVNTQYGVNIVRQLSNSNCNYNWGYDQTGIWVDRGCRAEFSLNFGWDQADSIGNIMVCESYNYQRNYCRAFLGGRDVFLINQLSNASCLNSWGYDRNGIWVSNGCRAEFAIEDRYGSQNDLLVCSSRNLRFQSCPANTRGGVDFIRQLSRASCNGNWGYDRNGIWVTNGCRAQFRLLNYNNGFANNYIQDTVSCSSRNLQKRVCSADTSGGVRLKKQRSRASCQGNWGYSNGQIWVDNGCRATFQLYINGGRGNAPLNPHANNRTNNIPFSQNYGNSNTQQHTQTNRIVCESYNLNRKTCPIPRGSKVQLYKQRSRASCVGKWGYNGREIWVTNGCRAEFKIL